VVTLVGYVVDVMVMLSTKPSKEDFKVPSLAEQNEDWND
jgi:hypothetical protein